MFRILFSVLRQNSCFILTFLLGFGLSVFLAPILFQKNCRLPSFKIDLDNFDKVTDNVDIFEPKINLAAKPKIALKPGHGMIRPRFHKAELGIRNKLFLGILTSPESIKTLAIALNKTVSKSVDRIMYFIDAPSAQRLNVSSLKLPGIVGFTDTRKSLKPFHLIKYVSDNFLDEYDFFFIIKDSAYIQGQMLRDFTKKISVKFDVHIGRIIKAQTSDNICSLDSGVLLSNSVVREIHSSLEWCVKNSVSKDDNVNFGQCIIHASQLPCSDTAQGMKFETYVLKRRDSKGVIPKAEDDLQKFKKSVIISRLSKAEDYYRIHFYFSQVLAAKINENIDELRSSVVTTMKGWSDVGEWPIASQPATPPTSHFDLLRWDHFTLTHKYLPDDFHNMAPLTGADKLDIHRIIKRCVNHVEEKYDGALMYNNFINGYQRFDPSRGMDYIVDIAFRETTSGKIVHKRLEVFKSLGKVEMVPVPYVTENIRVHLIMPIKSVDRERILSFLKQYSINAMEKKDLQFLMLVFIYSAHELSKGEDDIFREVKHKAITLSNKFEKVGNLIKWHSIKLSTNVSDVSVLTDPLLDFAVMDSVMKKFTSDSLILLGRPNMEVRLDYFNRVRMNTVSGFQIFSPIPFSEYHPDIIYNENLPQPPELDINKNYGHYDSMNFRHISFYTSDYYRARKKIEDTIPIIKYDKDILKLIPQSTVAENSAYYMYATKGIYGMFVVHSETHMMRAVEPSLRLRHTQEICSHCENVTQFIDYCTTTQAVNLATRSQLGRLLLDFQADVQ